MYLTDKQIEIYWFIQDFYLANKRMPTGKELEFQFEQSRHSISGILEKIGNAGYLVRLPTGTIPYAFGEKKI